MTISGEILKRVQAALIVLQFHNEHQLHADGEDGPQTNLMVRRFQQMSGLSPTGTVDQKTIGALWNKLQELDQPFNLERHPLVFQAAMLLVDADERLESEISLIADGDEGPVHTLALAWYQQTCVEHAGSDEDISTDVTESGVLDEATWCELTEDLLSDSFGTLREVPKL